MTLHDILRRRLLERAGLSGPSTRRPDLAYLCATQWSDEFAASMMRDLPDSEEVRRALQFMRNRLIMGAFRYGCFEEQRGTPYDNCASMVRHYLALCESHNLEHLIDIANLAMVEWLVPGGRGGATWPEWARGAFRSLECYLEHGDRWMLPLVASDAIRAFTVLSSDTSYHFHAIDDGEHTKPI